MAKKLSKRHELLVTIQERIIEKQVDGKINKLGFVTRATVVESSEITKIINDLWEAK